MDTAFDMITSTRTDITRPRLVKESSRGEDTKTFGTSLRLCSSSASIRV